uniref:Basement membrane-specific heparan sulfate proteoglycan core protein n=1 Tax=Steinernema glaseri TaxID=37863 RepID=A0A1I8AA30_9BILA
MSNLQRRLDHVQITKTIKSLSRCSFARARTPANRTNRHRTLQAIGFNSLPRKQVFPPSAAAYYVLHAEAAQFGAASQRSRAGNEKRSVLPECSTDEFRCKNGECIPKEQECNRHYDCTDGTDESQCEYFLAAARYHSGNRESAHEEKPSHHQEHHEEHQESEEAIQEFHGHEEHTEHHQEHSEHHGEPQHHHDHSSHHSNHQDHNEESEYHEIECSDQEFRCPYLKETVCFHYDKLCDGVDDCGDGSDEQKCDSGSVEDNTQCHEGEYQCANGQCIEESLKCNRKYDCEDGTDETECEYFKLAMNRHQSTDSERAKAEAELKHREEDERRREHLEREREQQELRREHEERRLEEEERHREAEERRRIEEERRRLDQAAKDNVIQIPAEHVQFKEEYDDDAEHCLEHEFMCHNGECIDRRRVCDSRHDCIDASDELDCPEEGHRTQHRQEEVPSAPTHRVNNRDVCVFFTFHQLLLFAYRMQWQPLVLLLAVSTFAYTSRRDRDVHERQHHAHQDVSSHQDIQITIYPDQVSVREGRDASFECRARTADNSFYPSVRWTRVGGPLPRTAQEGGGRLVINPVSLSDSGTYVCVATHNGRSVESHATLHVQSYGPQELQGFGGSTGAGSCMADEKSCANSECVKADYVCDGEPDCRDRSDEQNCPGPSHRACEPNEFKCHNNKCVQKMWLCDGDDDCGDGSDELNCGVKAAGELCKPTEFKCRSGQQCVPASFQCDGTNDCSDASDEFGCRQPEVVQPPETNKTVPVGSNFKLTCRAVAVPEAYINWRLNWGPVCDPPRCLQQSEGGVGTLTVNNAQPMDEGAYSCEAINVRGRVLATPDCIVRIVNIPAPTVAPPPPLPQVNCDRRGSATPYPDSRGQCQCKPLVTGPQCNQCAPGSYQLSEKSPQGCLKCFCFGITNQCQSSRWYRTKDIACEKLMFSGDAEGVTLSDMDERNVRQNERFEFNHPNMLTYTGNQYEPLYWRLPQRFLGNKVTAYGGKMSFEVMYSGSGGHSQEPVVVLKGNRITLVHRPRDQERLFVSDRPVKVDVDTYEHNYEHSDGRAATREDLMMVLADLDSYLIRAKHVDNQRSTSLGDVSWEIAVDRDTQGELALEVEHCSCPQGYMGLSCEDCAPGYERSGHGPYLGTCVPARPRGPTCSAGAISPVASYGGQCQCKLHTTGPLCDQCKPHSFHLAPTNSHGCIPCFCAGVTKECQSSSLRRDQVSIDYSRGDQDSLQLKSRDHRNPVSPRSQPIVTYGSISFDRFDETPGTTLYWSLPAKFLGNKVTSYGGYLKYTFRYSGAGQLTTDPDVILRGNDITFQYTHRQPFYADRDNTVEIKIVEDSFHRTNDQAATREHMIMALADIDEILIKATYLDDCSQSSLIMVSLDYATPHGSGLTAYEVEQCRCPPGYQGTSCETCAPGYSRTGGGLYLGLCERCECNGHATECDKEYGFCVNCQHNTEGEHCDRCKPGFVGDARRGTPHDCQPAATRPPCQCNNHSPRGCDSFGRCLFCEHNTEGVHCEQCKKGFYGVATRGTPYDCTPCPCPSASECFLDPQGQVQCRNCPAGYAGRLCNECGPGYARSIRPDSRDCEPIGVVNPGRVDFVNEVPRIEIVEPKHLKIVKGQRAKWLCRALDEHRWRDIRLSWHKVGTNALPPGAEVQGGKLILNSVEMADSGQYRCTGIASSLTPDTPQRMATDDATLTVSEGGQPPQPYIEPPHLRVPERSPAKFVCHVLDVNKCEVTWHKEYVGGPLPHGVYPQGDILQIPSVLPEHEGHYICTAINEYGLGRSNPAKLEVIRPVDPPRIDPIEQTVNDGDNARFRCWVPNNPSAMLTWKTRDGRPLPPGVEQNQGYLNFPRATQEHIGSYICTSVDPTNQNPPLDSPPATLNVRKPEGPVIDPPEQEVNVDEPARFRCWVPGNPNARLRFSKAGGQLPYGAQEHQGQLTIPHAQLADAGNYICTADDPTGGPPRDSSPAVLRVKTPEGPVIDPPEQEVNVDEPARFRCHVPGNPNARLRFSKAGGQLPYGAQEHQGQLTIPHTQLADAGSYICTADDPAGGPPRDSKPAVLRVNTPQGPVIDPPEQEVNVDEPARFRCHVPGNPNARLRFSKPGGQLPHGAQEHQGHLTIPRAQMADAGNYICTAEDPTGGPPRDSTPAVLRVKSPEGPIIDPPEQEVNENEPARFRCHVPGNPHARLRFSKPGGQLPHGAQESHGHLTIPRAQLTDAGSYICTAEDPRGGAPRDSTPAVLRVKSPQKPLVDPPVKSVLEGEPAQFRCWLPGNPKAQLRWFKEGHQPLPQGAYERDGVLYVPRARIGDAGNYVCTAYDPQTRVPVDSDPATLQVNISPQQAAPIKPLVDPPEQTVDENDDATIRCWVPDQPGIHLRWRKADNQPLPHGALDRDGHLTIRRAQHADAGNYICSAVDPRTHEPIDSDPARVNVRSETPRPLVTPPHQEVEEDEPATFRCYVPGGEDEDFRWGFRTPTGSLPDDVTEEDGEITIHRARPHHAGEFYCMYDGPDGPKISDPARLKVKKPSGPPKPVATPPEQTVKTGAPARFHCDAHSPTPAQIHWGYKVANGPLPEDVHQEGDDVVIDHADESNIGEYVCTATNEVGTGEADPVRLDISDEEIPPTAQVVPPVWNGQPGETHKFKCHVTGVPPPQVSWTGPDGGELPENVRDIGNHELEITDAKASMNGEYTCHAVNIVGEASDTGIVNVAPHLVIKTTPAGPIIRLTVGEPLEVKCEAFGEPEPEVEWLHDPGPIRGDLPDDFKPVTISEQFIRHPAVGLGNSGVYTCRGFNSHASATKDIHVEVVQASRIATVSILGGAVQHFPEGEPAELVCTSTGPSLVERLEWSRVDNSLPAEVEDHNEPGFLHFGNFKREYAGEYECRGYRNNEVIASASVKIHADGHVDSDIPRVEITSPRVKVVNEGESIILDCIVEGDAHNGVNYNWALLRSGSLIRRLGSEAQLIVKKADPTNDFGVYRCEVEDDNGQHVGSAFAAVTVGHSSPESPQIVRFDDKSDASFVCPVFSVPGAVVTWEKENDHLPPNAEPHGNRLHIKDFDASASGMYVCRVKVDHNTAEGYVDAQIYVPDSIIQVRTASSTESFVPGERAWVDCVVTGDPNAEVRWSKEGSDHLPPNTQVTGIRLQFTQVTEDDDGVYVCHASTSAGNLVTRTVIKVTPSKRKRKHTHSHKRNHTGKLRANRHTIRKERQRPSSVFAAWTH